MNRAIKIIDAFRQEEYGLALTEYLILLGLLVGGVIVGVIGAGNGLEAAWVTWGTFWSTTASYTP